MAAPLVERVCFGGLRRRVWGRGVGSGLAVSSARTPPPPHSFSPFQSANRNGARHVVLQSGFLGSHPAAWDRSDTPGRVPKVRYVRVCMSSVTWGRPCCWGGAQGPLPSLLCRTARVFTQLCGLHPVGVVMATASLRLCSASELSEHQFVFPADV